MTAGATAGDSVQAYSDSAEAWAAGPVAMYRRLADVLVASSPIPLGGAFVLDLGAGTGAASDAIEAAGARCVAADAAAGMLAFKRSERPPAVAALAEALPFSGGAFDAVVAACCVNHCADPVRALAECGRVVRSCGAVLASTFSADAPQHPVKSVVEDVLTRHGYVRPEWYAVMKSAAEPLTGSVEALASVAAGAGLTDVNVGTAVVDTGVTSAADLVRYRLGMAQYAGWVRSRPAAEQEAIHAEALDALGPAPPPLRPALLLLAARSRS